MPSMTSSPISTRRPPRTSGSTTTLRWTVAVVLLAESAGEPAAASASLERPGDPHGGDGLAAAVSAATCWYVVERRGRRCGRCRRRACSASATVAGSALPSSSASSSAALSVDRARRVGQRVAQLGVRRRRSGRTANSSSLDLVEPARRSAGPTAAATPSCSSASARSRGARPALPHGRRRPARATPSPSRAAEDAAATSPALASAVDRRRRSATRRSAGSASQHGGDARTARRRASAASRAGARARRPARPARSASAPRSISGTARSPAAVGGLQRLEVGEEPLDRRGSAASSSSRDSPTMRPASVGGQRADLGAQRGDRLLALGLDLRVRVLDDPVGLGLGLLAHLRDDLRRPARAPPRGSWPPRAGRRRAAPCTPPRRLRASALASSSSANSLADRLLARRHRPVDRRDDVLRRGSRP